ncbi:UNVERIFIED_ORG: hypothetical protein ABIC97_000176 [Peribacillus simplex]
MFTESVGRLLKPLEEEIIADIVAYPDEKRIAILEYIWRKCPTSKDDKVN